MSGTDELFTAPSADPLAGRFPTTSGVDQLIGRVEPGATSPLVIVGRMSMWHPVDMLFFERVPLIRDQRVLCRIQGADIRVRNGTDEVVQ